MLSVTLSKPLVLLGMSQLETTKLTGRLYQGMESTCGRHMWWNAGYFGAIYWVKSLLPKSTVSNPFTKQVI